MVHLTKSASLWAISTFLLWITGITADSNPYCSIPTCILTAGGMTGNTLCQHSTSTFGPDCDPPFPASVTTDDEDIIVKLHNDFRRIVATGQEQRGDPGPQPPASNMRQMVWDEELATMAQAHAQQCHFKHDSCRDVGRFQVGQNLYIKMSTAPIQMTNWTEAIKSWYDEVNFVSSDHVASFHNTAKGVIGHYTQLLWADSFLVGCGIASYKDTKNMQPSFPFKVLYACNYGPAGNWLSLPVYQQGSAGSSCPPGTSHDNGLCVSH